MKKILFCLLILVSINTVNAQEEIPVFDDPISDTPNIGRMAQPLNKLVLTPNPLPSVSINLSGQKDQKNKQLKTAQKTVSAENSTAKNQTPAATQGKTEFNRTTPIVFKTESGIMPIKRRTPATEKEETTSDTQTQQPSQAQENASQIVQNYASQTTVTTSSNTTSLTQSATSNTGYAASTPLLQSAEAIENLFGKTHDVRGFELSGLTLGMTPDEVAEIMGEMGFKRTQVRFGIPMFRSAFYEQNCRDRRVHILNDVRKCIERQADKDDVKYISSMTFKKAQTKEYIRVLFSSHATDNQAFKIYYESEGDNSLTMTQRNLAKQLRRKEMFWNMMFENYGLPDDSELIVWGDTDKAYMQAIMTGSAYNAYIVLEDKEIQDTDYFAAEDEKETLNYRPQFTFAPYEGDE